MKFPDKLKQWRERHHLTLETAGEVFGVSGRCVHKWEKGELPKPATMVGAEVLMARRDGKEDVR